MVKKALFILMLAGTSFAASIPFQSGTPDQIIDAIDKVGTKKKSDAATIKQLGQALKNTNNSVKIRERSAWALGQLKANSQTAVLMEAAHDKGLLVRHAAVSALLRLRAKTAIPLFIDVAQQDPVRMVRLQAIAGLGLMDAEKAIQPLVDLSKDADESIRGGATLSMAALHSKKNNFSEVMDDMKKDPSGYVQDRAQVGFNIIQKKTPALHEALSSDQPDIRLFAAHYFNQNGKFADSKILQKTLNSEPNDDVRDELELALHAVKARRPTTSTKKPKK